MPLTTCHIEIFTGHGSSVAEQGKITGRPIEELNVEARKVLDGLPVGLHDQLAWDDKQGRGEVVVGVRGLLYCLQGLEVCHLNSQKVAKSLANADV